MVFPLEAKGRLNSAEDFENIIVRTNRDGGLLRLKDIAKVEIGFENYLITSDLDGQTNVPIMLNKLSGANSLKAMNAVKEELKRLSQYYPEDFDIVVSYDATEFIRISVEEVLFTLFLLFSWLWRCVIYFAKLAGNAYPFDCYSCFCFGDFCSNACFGL